MSNHNITVVVRVRGGATNDDPVAWKWSDKTMEQTIDESQMGTNVEMFRNRSASGVVRDFHSSDSISDMHKGVKTSRSRLEFEYDQVYGPEAATADMFDSSLKDLVASTCQGFNGTIFAYGPTGSGKTHSIIGSNDDPGLFPLTLMEIFKYIGENTSEQFLLQVAYYEIDQEDIKDLLADEDRPVEKLKVADSPESGPIILGLTLVPVSKPEDAVEQLLRGNRKRRRMQNGNQLSPHPATHAVLQLKIESTPSSSTTESETIGDSMNNTRVAQLNLIDLAGSEKMLGPSGTGGLKLNASLLTLGNVIAKLSENAAHIPYRDSKLTRILSTSLGGNARTAIVCHCTAGQRELSNTLNTLRFGSRAMRVVNRVRKNSVRSARSEMDRYKKEIGTLRKQLSDVRVGSHAIATEAENEQLKIKLKEMESLLLDSNSEATKEVKRAIDTAEGGGEESKLAEPVVRKKKRPTYRRRSIVFSAESMQEAVDGVLDGGAGKNDGNDNSADEETPLPPPRPKPRGGRGRRMSMAMSSAMTRMSIDSNPDSLSSSGSSGSSSSSGSFSEALQDESAAAAAAAFNTERSSSSSSQTWSYTDADVGAKLAPAPPAPTSMVTATATSSTQQKFERAASASPKRRMSVEMRESLGVHGMGTNDINNADSFSSPAAVKMLRGEMEAQMKTILKLQDKLALVDEQVFAEQKKNYSLVDQLRKEMLSKAATEATCEQLQDMLKSVRGHFEDSEEKTSSRTDRVQTLLSETRQAVAERDQEIMELKESLKMEQAKQSLLVEAEKKAVTSQHLADYYFQRLVEFTEARESMERATMFEEERRTRDIAAVLNQSKTWHDMERNVRQLEIELKETTKELTLVRKDATTARRDVVALENSLVEARTIASRMEAFSAHLATEMESGGDSGSKKGQQNSGSRLGFDNRSTPTTKLLKSLAEKSQSRVIRLTRTPANTHSASFSGNFSGNGGGRSRTIGRDSNDHDAGNHASRARELAEKLKDSEFRVAGLELAREMDVQQRARLETLLSDLETGVKSLQLDRRSVWTATEQPQTLASLALRELDSLRREISSLGARDSNRMEQIKQIEYVQGGLHAMGAEDDTNINALRKDIAFFKPLLREELAYTMDELVLLNERLHVSYMFFSLFLF